MVNVVKNIYIALSLIFIVFMMFLLGIIPIPKVYADTDYNHQTIIFPVSNYFDTSGGSQMNDSLNYFGGPFTYEDLADEFMSLYNSQNIPDMSDKILNYDYFIIYTYSFNDNGASQNYINVVTFPSIDLDFMFDNYDNAELSNSRASRINYGIGTSESYSIESSPSHTIWKYDFNSSSWSGPFTNDLPAYFINLKSTQTDFMVESSMPIYDETSEGNPDFNKLLNIYVPLTYNGSLTFNPDSTYKVGFIFTKEEEELLLIKLFTEETGLSVLPEYNLYEYTSNGWKSLLSTAPVGNRYNIDLSSYISSSSSEKFKIMFDCSNLEHKKNILLNYNVDNFIEYIYETTDKFTEINLSDYNSIIFYPKDYTIETDTSVFYLGNFQIQHRTNYGNDVSYYAYDVDSNSYQVYPLLFNPEEDKDDKRVVAFVNLKQNSSIAKIKYNADVLNVILFKNKYDNVTIETPDGNIDITPPDTTEPNYSSPEESGNTSNTIGSIVSNVYNFGAGIINGVGMLGELIGEFFTFLPPIVKTTVYTTFSLGLILLVIKIIL